MRGICSVKVLDPQGFGFDYGNTSQWKCVTCWEAKNPSITHLLSSNDIPNNLRALANVLEVEGPLLLHGWHALPCSLRMDVLTRILKVNCSYSVTLQDVISLFACRKPDCARCQANLGAAKAGDTLIDDEPLYAENEGFKPISPIEQRKQDTLLERLINLFYIVLSLKIPDTMHKIQRKEEEKRENW